MRILELQCNSLQLLCQNLENCHSESLEDSLLMFSPDYILLRKINFRQQTGLLSKKSSIVFFHSRGLDGGVLNFQTSLILLSLVAPELH